MRRLNKEELQYRVEILLRHMDMEHSSYDLETGTVIIANRFKSRSFYRKPNYTKDGYEFYTLRSFDTKKSYTFYTHHIVMMLADPEEYVEQMSKGMTINHINGNRQDNSLSNLEYVTPAENNQHQHTIAPVDIYTAYGILREHYLEGKTPKDIKEEYGLSYSKVHAILKGRAYRLVIVCLWS